MNESENYDRWAVDATGFCCGKGAFDEYIRRYASQDVRRLAGTCQKAAQAGTVLAVAGIVVGA